MNSLPKFLRFAPKALYLIAIFILVFTVWINWTVMQSTQAFPELEPDRAAQLASILKSESFVMGFVEAAYMAATGAIVQVLIAIYDRVGRVKENAE